MTSARAIDRSRLAAALNAIEGGSDTAGALVDAAWAAPRGKVIGVTGPPGVGKSTLAGRFVEGWRGRGLTVGALAIDPSSRRSGGALLGDRLRMRLSGDDRDVFVRSMAARGELGGLGPRSFEAVTVMREAVDRVLVETVGVGQSEVAVSRLADVTVVVIQPGSGDALQFLKAGLMEVFDLLVVNKADLGALAEGAARELRSALRVQGRRDVPVVTVSAELGSGIESLMNAVEELAARDELGERRLEALREVTLERFARWHGERTVKALGGRQALVAALEAVAAPTPSSLAAALERMAQAPPVALPASGSKPWASELEVDRDAARALVGGVAPELAEVEPKPLGSGWDNTAWLFEQGAERWVFRFPRRALAVPFMTRELEVMPKVARHVPLAVTTPRWRGTMPNGWPFAGYRFMEGEMAAVSGLSDADKVELASAWGDFLHQLHSLDPAALGVELPTDPLRKVDVLKRWDVTVSTLATTGTMSDAIMKVLERARTVWTTSPPRPVVLSHGDLDARHLIVERRADGVRASGVIDWGDVMLADPAIDLALAVGFLEGEARAAFFEAYGPIDEDTEALARFRAIASQVWVLSWALDIGHVEHAAEARRALARATR